MWSAWSSTMNALYTSSRIFLPVGGGDTIAVDQPVLEVETDKATVEVPASVAGKVSAVHVKAGDEIAVGQAVLSVEGEAKPAAPAAACAPHRAASIP